MKENESKFLCEFFALISKYNVSFGASSEPTAVYVGNRQIGEIVEKDCNTSFNIDLTLE